MTLAPEGLITHCSNHVFRTGTNTELSAPNTKARTDIEASIVTLILTEGTFVDRLSNPGNRPYLSVVGMPAKLEINASCCRTVKVVGLMV